MSPVLEKYLPKLLISISDYNSDSSHKVITLLFHDKTGETFAQEALVDGLNQIKDNIDKYYKSRLSIQCTPNDVAYIEAMTIVYRLEFIEILEYVADNFSSQIAYVLPRITATYRMIGKPEYSIKRFLYYFNKYGAKTIYTSATFTSVSAAYKDLALKYDEGSVERERFKQLSLMFKDLAKEQIANNANIEYLENLMISIDANL